MLPALREEIGLYRAAPGADGAPAWSLYDPVRNLYFRIDWLSFEILRRWHLGRPDTIAANISAATTIEAEPGDVEAVTLFLHQNQLLQPVGEQATRDFLKLRRSARQSGWQWLMHRYLFFRVPLLRPDAWLTRHVDLTAPFFNRGFVIATALALMVGLVLVSRDWDRFQSTLIDVFILESLLLFGVSLVFVKVLHELGHAFTAKRFGCRVPTMGVAFLLLFPLAYTDVNDAWRLTRRRERLLVGGAGILVELSVAVWSTLAWTLVPDSGLRHALFLLATTTWVSTLIVNASPFLRFDGYFLLMDAVDMPNLHQRSFAVARAGLRRWLFGASGMDEEHFPPNQTRLLTLFAWATWGYRFVVFLGIALLVYHWFPKPLGPVMAGFELWWFLGLPVFREIRGWPGLAAGQLRRGGRPHWLPVLLGVLLVLVLPWSSRVTSEGVLRPETLLRVTAPANGVVSFHVANGAEAAPGTPLVTLSAPFLESRQIQADVRDASAQWRAALASVSDALREQRNVLLADQSRSRSEREGISEQLEQLQIDASFQGQFFHTDPDLKSGDWVAVGTQLGLLAAATDWRVESYVREEDLDRIAVGDNARFYPETPGTDTVSLRIRRIDTDAVRELAHPMLGSVNGGALPVRDRGGALVPEQALYRIVLTGTNAAAGNYSVRFQRGRVVVFGEREALVSRFWQQALAVFYREAGL